MINPLHVSNRAVAGGPPNPDFRYVWVFASFKPPAAIRSLHPECTLVGDDAVVLEREESLLGAGDVRQIGGGIALRVSGDAAVRLAVGEEAADHDLECVACRPTAQSDVDCLSDDGRGSAARIR